MAGTGAGRLRVGVVGLGRLWEARYRPALAKLRDHFHVVAVYDQVPRRAEIQAAQLGCRAAYGLAELVEARDVEAVSILTPQWFGLHPIGLAARAGKAIYCALPIAAEGEDLDRLDRAVRESGVPFMPELARRFHPATSRLLELLEGPLGPARRIAADVRVEGFDRYGQPGPTTQITPAPLRIDPGIYLIDWCRFIFGGEPIALRRRADRDPPGPAESETIEAEFAGGRAARITIGRALGDPRAEAGSTVEVEAERGTARIEGPDRIAWAGTGGERLESLPGGPPIGETLKLRFLRYLLEGPGVGPTWDDAIASARLVDRLDRGDPARDVLTS